MDAQYVDAPGTSENGRYMPAWSISGDSSLQVEPVAFDWKTTMQENITTEYVLEPTLIQSARGDMILVTTVGCPIKDNGVIKGYTGITFEMSEIHAIVDEINPFGDGHTFVFSSGGLVAAHSDPERLGKDMRETETDTFGPFLDTMVEAVTTGKSPPSHTAPLNRIQSFSTIPFPLLLGMFQNRGHW